MAPMISRSGILRKTYFSRWRTGVLGSLRAANELDRERDQVFQHERRSVLASSNYDRMGLLSSERHPVIGRRIQWRDWGGFKGIKVLPSHKSRLHRESSDRAQYGISFVIGSPVNPGPHNIVVDVDHGNVGSTTLPIRFAQEP